ncbi:MAG: bifunctional aldolase/short-chain dehydrogenase [Thermoleophilia bacterium]|nr:bifunctional aldolase/short-chain dehydrogenase [Thermoleophilia bacterium]
MNSRWSDYEAAEFVARFGDKWGEALALRTYSSRLLGLEKDLVLHGGGNTSVKATWRNILGDEIPALFVKASGADLATIEPEGHCGLDLAYLKRLRQIAELSDEEMLEELRTHRLWSSGPDPSIEALVHAFLPHKFVDHTHADAVLALTNRVGGEQLVRQVFGDEVIILPYITPGLKLAKACAEALESFPTARGMVWMHHGIVTWGATARESYEAMIELVTRAEGEVAARARGPHGRAPAPKAPTPPSETVLSAATCDARIAEISPVLRGLLAHPTGDPDHPYQKVVLKWLCTPEVLEILAMPGAKEALVTPVLTSDHLIRTKALPLWVEELPQGDQGTIREHLQRTIDGYRNNYLAYLGRYQMLMPRGVQPFAPEPRVVMIPGLGVACAGEDLRSAVIAQDITLHTLRVKRSIVLAGSRYEGLPEEELFRMEYRSLQHAKLKREDESAKPTSSGAELLKGHVAVVTGAAGAIGAGICEALLRAGCLVAATDLPGERLDALVADYQARFGEKILGIPMDVTDPASVKAGFAEVVCAWGGIDLVVPNAGIAAVGSLAELSLEKFRRLEQVNVEGTLFVLAEAARLFRAQGTGGDVVVISTKNVFSPGAGFGAYSATKAAAHQLARVASLELAADGVRVNMVSPDAVFGHGARRSGLWQEVGPERMRVRGLDEAGLEAYYQNRNLLKARVTAEHVANAVLFFATRQTPTTGATIPVDGGLPDATPR